MTTKKRKTLVVQVVEKAMKMLEIKEKARALGINPGKMNKAELIHAIQTAEGNTPCFGKSNGHCPHTNCCFVEDCLKIRVLNPAMC